jgi:flagellar motor protein MotB
VISGDDAFDPEGTAEQDPESAPVWIAVSDLMTGLLGLFVLFFVWSLVLQADVQKDLEHEKQARVEDRQQLQALEGLLAGPLASGRISLVNGRIGIRGSVLFDLNSADLKEEGQGLLQELAGPLGRYLAGRGEIIMVSGFTDDLPIHGRMPQFEDNWELSAQRALTVTRALVGAGLGPDLLFAAGFGEHHPAVPNADDATRARNRRVEIVPVPRSQDGATPSAAPSAAPSVAP